MEKHGKLWENYSINGGFFMGNTAINGGFVELHGETAAPHHLPWPNPQARSFDAPAPMQKRNRSSLSVFHVGNARSKQRFHEVYSLHHL